jgi:hypothetical protein
MTKPINSPFLRTSRDFPEEPQVLSMELNKMYIDISSAVNQRTVGLFPTTRPAQNGESWFTGGAGTKREGQRQIYTFTGTGNIPHGLNLANISSFTRGFGSFTDNTNWYGVIFGSSTAIAAQVSFYIGTTNIVVLAGAGAPSITSGILVVEWLGLP